MKHQPAVAYERPVAIPARPERSTLQLATRLTRRGIAVLAVATAAYVALEVASFSRIYPDGVSADQFALFADNPAARMLQGVPRGIDTAGGFTAWDAGYFIELALGIWAILVTTRLLRGEEDAGRTEMMLVGPIGPGRAAGLQLGVVYAGALLTGLAVAVALAVTSSQLLGASLFGLGLAGFTATFAGIGAVTSQLVRVRRRAAGIGSSALAAAFLLRMVANSTDGRAWLGWFTPFGWMDRLQAFENPSPAALALLLVAPVVLAVATVDIRGRRDTGGSLLEGADRHQPRLRGLSSPMAFGWRANRAVLVGWVLTVGAYAFVLGALVSTMIDFLTRDESYQQAMRDLGLDLALDARGFLGVMGVTLGVAFALYAAFRLANARAEEESGRADQFLTRPVTRTRWLAGHVVLAVVGAAMLGVVTGLAIWAGALMGGSNDVSLTDALASVGNTASIVVLVTGLGVLSFGLMPRLTLVVPLGVTVVGYVLMLLGPALSWPAWVVDLSPFTHLAYVPAEPFAATPALFMTALGLAGVAVGITAFRHRDITDA